MNLYEVVAPKYHFELLFCIFYPKEGASNYEAPSFLFIKILT